MKQMNNKSRRLIFYPIFAFLLPLLISCAAFAALKITPFGNQSLVVGDADGYYVNWISSFVRMLHGEHSFFYSFSKGAGGNMTSLTSLYLLSPYMIIFFFAGPEQMAVAFSVAVIFMASLTGLFMYLLLRDVYGYILSNLIFSTSYALIGFSVVNNYNIPFSVGPLMLPLVMLGLRKILKDKFEDGRVVTDEDEVNNDEREENKLSPCGEDGQLPDDYLKQLDEHYANLLPEADEPYSTSNDVALGNTPPMPNNPEGTPDDAGSTNQLVSPIPNPAAGDATDTIKSPQNGGD